MRRAAKRDESEPGIVSALEAMGCTVFRLSLPVDLLVGYLGVTHLVEVKTPAERGKEGRGKGKMTELQGDFMETWRGETVAVVFTVEEAVALVKTWQV